MLHYFYYVPRNSIIRFLTRLRSYFWSHKLIFAYFWAAWISIFPSLLTAYYSSDKFSSKIRAAVPKIADFLDENIVYAMILSIVIWVPISCLIRSVIVKSLRTEPISWENAPQLVLKALDGIVGYKEKRFVECHQSFSEIKKRGEAITADRVFKEITNPKAQINRIVEAIHHTFGFLTQKPGSPVGNITTSLAFIQNGVLRDFICSFPANHKISAFVGGLSNENSTIMTCFKSERLIAISSVLNEKTKKTPRYVTVCKENDDEDGSLLCYPIKLTNLDADVVVSIFHPEAGVFDDRFRNKYREVLETFALRIRLEFALLDLRRIVENEDTPT
ncbi:hypothetical protein NMQ14_17610 [Methyloversatilis sp. XJ19-13]|uniref:hypothetical protein n=1 Tax=Methyloversatilis sp. XJ19-13 TaxID=2963430 RepID=UPI00211C8A44|nr:hypothetical protein [Methyloversatilis sp. XJ19-13]MCQ9376068.1 hypothetical protein [Methyloversatilis sp. XJ19-13]